MNIATAIARAFLGVKHDPRTESRNREEIVPEGHYRAGPSIEPAWLAGRLLIVEHQHHRGYWLVTAKALSRGHVVVREQITWWDGEPVTEAS